MGNAGPSLAELPVIPKDHMVAAAFNTGMSAEQFGDYVLTFPLADTAEIPMDTASMRTVARVVARTVPLLLHPENLSSALSRLLWPLEQLRLLVLQLMVPVELRIAIPSAAIGLMATAAPCMDFGKDIYHQLIGYF